MAQLNTGKSPDIYGLTIENILYAGESAMNFLLRVVNTIFEAGVISHCLKTGLLTPIFKNKGERNNSKNYRRITVLPVIGKILEAIIKNRIQETLESEQNKAQRGFTANISPLNAALIIEEVIRDCN